jgi:hypothetical protein
LLCFSAAAFEIFAADVAPPALAGGAVVRGRAMCSPQSAVPYREVALRQAKIGEGNKWTGPGAQN